MSQESDTEGVHNLLIPVVGVGITIILATLALASLHIGRDIDAIVMALLSLINSVVVYVAVGTEQ